MESIIISKLGQRKLGHRLWVEESITKPRLERNGFLPDTFVTINSRQGTGFIIKPSSEKTKHKISKRGSKSLLSFEGEWLKVLFPWDTAKLRVSSNAICIVPALSVFGFIKTGVAEIQKEVIVMAHQKFTWDNRKPWRSKPNMLVGDVTDLNLLLVSYFIHTHLPKTIELKSESLLFPTLQPLLRGLKYQVKYTGGDMIGELC